MSGVAVFWQKARGAGRHAPPVCGVRETVKENHLPFSSHVPARLLFRLLPCALGRLLPRTLPCALRRLPRRFLPRALACPLLLLPLLAACSAGEAKQPEGYVLYFPEQSFAAGTGALRPVPARLKPDPEASPQAEAVKLVMELLQGPRQEDLRSAFPIGTNLRSLNVEGSRATLDFSGGYGTLSGVALTLADYSVALTLTQLPEISVVRITVRGQDLAYRDRQSFTARDVLLEPETDVAGTVRTLLYFPNGAGELLPEERNLSLYEGETQVEAVTEAVEGGPEDRNLLSPFPEEFRVRSVWQEGDLCFVNLSSALLETLPPETDLAMCLRALDQSLSSLENVREVRYLVDGEFVGSYGGVSLTDPYGQAAAGG